MAEVTRLELPDPYFFDPELMAAAETPFPLVDDYLVPLQFSELNTKFEKERPTLEILGEGALRLSLAKPFAFVRMVEIPGQSRRRELSQRTGSLTIAPSLHIKAGWCLDVMTDLPLTEQDERLFILGVETYARYAANRLVDMGLLS